MEDKEVLQNAQASIDFVYKAEGSDSFVQRVESRNGLLVLEYAEDIVLGSRYYKMVNIDD